MTDPASNITRDVPDVAGWVRRAQQGDQQAFGDLMQFYHQRVFGVLFGMVRNADDAKDLSQQAWVKAWNKLDTYKGDAEFYTWMYRLVTFVGLDYLRKRKRRKEVELLDGIEPVQDVDAPVAPSRASRPDEAAHQADIQRVFDRALESLSPEHRAALLLREVENLSYDEIAKVLKCRKGTVMSRIFYARKKIQEDLGDLR